MMLVFKVLGGLVAFSAIARAQTTDDFKTKCTSFRPNIPNAKFEFAELVQSGTAANLPYADKTCGGPQKSEKVAQDVCRVTMYLETSARSGVQFEAWFPKTWNGRFLATGNGGIGGCVDYTGLVYTTQNGFAAVGSNNGHNGTHGTSFFNNPDVVEDFAGRSLHTITVSGKVASEQFYGRSHTKSYFLGCSQGGRQGVGAAEKFPADFDGIVAGSPALDFNNLVSWRAHFVTITGTVGSPDFITPEVWTNVIHPEILKQCDELDGAKDGIIETPDRCNFNVATLICRDGNTQNCITLNQSYRVYAIFHDYKHGTPSNELIYPGINYGAELRAVDRLLSGKPFSDSVDWFRYVVRKDPAFDPLTFSTQDAAASRDLNPSNIRTFPSDLADFRSRNNKLLVYHGMQDQQITSHNTARWYDQLVTGAKMSPDQLDTWIRYFRISGMNHCAGGPGAWMIGQGLAGVKAAKDGLDAKANVLAAIVGWVEDGVAPELIEGTKLKDDGSVAFTRKHCKYPKRNQFKAGAVVKDVDGSKVTDANDWECI